MNPAAFHSSQSNAHPSRTSVKPHTASVHSAEYLSKLNKLLSLVKTTAGKA